MINKNKFTEDDFKQRTNKINLGWKYKIIEFNGYK